MFRLEISTDNQAFRDYPTGEIIRILRVVADQVQEEVSGADCQKTIWDINGQPVGMWSYTHEDD